MSCLVGLFPRYQKHCLYQSLPVAAATAGDGGGGRVDDADLTKATMING